MIAEARNPAMPVASGSGPEPERQALLSLGEIEALCLKAARGAGMEWGLAEEAGFAARWLAAQGVPGPALLLAHLKDVADRGWSAGFPVISGRHWTARSGPGLCPVAAGAALSDRAGMDAGPGCGALVLGATSVPALILPFASLAAGRLGRSLHLTWAGCRVVVSPEGIVAAEGDDALRVARCDGIRVEPADTTGRSWRVPAAAGVAPDCLRELEAFALRTTVPSSDQSRHGAGSARSDND